MKISKAWFLSLLAVISLTSTASDKALFPNFSGKYAGLALGGIRNLNSVVSESKAVFNTRINGIITNQLNADEDLHALTGGGSLYVGIAKHWNRRFLAAQLGANFSRNEITSQKESKTLDIRNEVSYQLSTDNEIKALPVEFFLDVKPGYLFSETLYYGLVGLALNRVEINATSQLVATNLANGVSYLSSINNNYKQYHTGLRTGVGVETPINPNFSFSLAYIYTYYGSQSNRSTGTAYGFSQQTGTASIPKSNGLSSQIKYTLRKEQLLASIHYYNDIV